MDVPKIEFTTNWCASYLYQKNRSFLVFWANYWAEIMLCLIPFSLFFRQCRNVEICHYSTTCWHPFKEFQDMKFSWRNTSKSYQKIRLTEPILKVSRYFIPITFPPSENFGQGLKLTVVGWGIGFSVICLELSSQM